MRCDITCYAVPVNNYANSPSVAQALCTTHQWMFPQGVPVHDGLQCPIGRIEEATDKALADIESAAKKQKQY